MPRKLTVVFGAGASFSCGGGAGTQAIPSYRPPLTDQIFSDHGAYRTILQGHVGVANLLTRLDREITKLGGIEAALSEFDKIASIDTRVQYLQVALYLRDLFWQCSDNFI